MPIIFPYIFSALLLITILPHSGYGQENDTINGNEEAANDTITTAADSLQQESYFKKLKFEGIRLGGSASGAVQTLFFPGRQKIGAHMDLGIGRYMLVGEVGFNRIKRTDKSFDETTDFTYINNGFYYRAGIDVNFLKDKSGRFDPDGNAIFFGFRYAGNKFRDEITFPVNNELFGSQNVTFTNNNAGAHWLELAAGMKIKVLPYFFLGYNVLYKFRRRLNSPENFESYDLPGFGRGNTENTVGLEYYMLFHLPFK